MLKNYFAPTPKHIKKLLLLIKAALSTIAVSQYMDGNPKGSLICAVILGVINEALNFTTETPSNNEGVS